MKGLKATCVQKVNFLTKESFQIPVIYCGITGSTDGTTDCREHEQVSDELKPDVRLEPLSSHALFSLAATGNGLIFALE